MHVMGLTLNLAFEIARLLSVCEKSDANRCMWVFTQDTFMCSKRVEGQRCLSYELTLRKDLPSIVKKNIAEQRGH